MPKNKEDALDLQFEKKFDREKRETKECLTDLCQLLSHNTSSTRRQLVWLLRQRADFIENEIELDSFCDEFCPQSE